MRAAAILGLGSSAKELEPFQQNSDANWLLGLPANSNDADAVLIFGGDGTIHRHLAQLAKLRLPVLVVPCGSGNDFARALNLRGIRDSVAAWRRFASGGANVRTIDLGVITPLKSAHPQSESRRPETGSWKYFCCVGGVGLDAEVAARANGLPRWLRRRGGYVLSLLPALARFAPLPMKITVANKDQDGALVGGPEKPTILAAFANAPTYGGGMKIAPKAQLDDGQLDVCVITGVDRFKLFCTFPTIYFGGHLRISGIDYFQTERLRLETERPLEVYADGEFVCHTPIEVAVARGALRVVVP